MHFKMEEYVIKVSILLVVEYSKYNLMSKTSMFLILIWIANLLILEYQFRIWESK